MLWNVLEPVLVPAQLVFAMLGMGATMTLADFKGIVKDPRGLGIGLLLQVVFVPLIALSFIHGLGLEKGWAVGLLLVSVVPGGAFSNLLTFLGKGNVALSISITTLTTLGCILTVPLALRVAAGTFLPPDFAFPVHRIVVEIFGYLLFPLALGMTFRRVVPGRASRFSTWCIRLSLALIVAIALGSVGSGRIRVIAYGWQPPLVIFLFGVALATLIPQLSRLFGRYDEDTIAIGLEVTVRNVGLGLLLVHFFFPGEDAQGHVLYSGLFYAGISPLFALPLLFLHRLGRGAVPFRRPHPRPSASVELGE